MSLQDEIDIKTSQIYRESYQMSIGELINLYKDGELDIHPEFQRVFRWNDYQKTKLIESIILNIPIPPIFVSQNEEGVWDVIDGVQRLSTIFEFVGLLKNDKGDILPPLKLLETDYLPSLKDVLWNDSSSSCFSKELQLSFKRSRIDVIIMKKESDPNAKYELFQRLNTGGSQLSEQEVRNCLMIMTNKYFYDFILNLDCSQRFIDCIPISDRKIDEQYRLELLLRLLIANYIDFEKVNNYSDLSELLNKETLSLCSMKLDYSKITDSFNKTFNLINSVFGEDAFKKFSNNKFLGPVLSSSFQTIAVGVFRNIEQILLKNDKEKWLKDKVHSLYTDHFFLKYTEHGVRPISRFKELSLFGFDYFRP